MYSWLQELSFFALYREHAIYNSLISTFLKVQIYVLLNDCIRILKGHNRKTHILKQIKAIAHLLFSKRHRLLYEYKA